MPDHHSPADITASDHILDALEYLNYADTKQARLDLYHEYQAEVTAEETKNAVASVSTA